MNIQNGTQYRYINCTDNELIAYFQNGDDTAFDYLIKKYITAWQRLIFNLCRNNEDVNDILQDSFITAMKVIKEGKFQGGNFSSWMGKIAYNRFRTLYRKKKLYGMDSTDENYFADVHILYEDAHAQYVYK